MTEAEDASRKQFSLERCMETLTRRAPSPLPNLLESIYADVLAHCSPRLPADDCTMRAVRRA